MEKALIRHLKPSGSVSDLGRIASILAGASLIIKAFNGRKKIAKSLAGGYLLYRGITGHCPVGERFKAEAADTIDITVGLTVNKTRAEAFNFWRQFSNLPLFMKHLKSVSETSGGRSRWTAVLPGHLGEIAWEAEITEEKENERLCWRSVDHSDIENSGCISFKDAGKFGTELQVTICYKAPAGKLGASVAKLINPLFTAMLRQDITNFRRYIETAEIPTTKGQPTGS